MFIKTMGSQNMKYNLNKVNLNISFIYQLIQVRIVKMNWKGEIKKAFEDVYIKGKL